MDENETYPDALLLLIVLENGADGSGRGAEGAVQHVHVRLGAALPRCLVLALRRISVSSIVMKDTREEYASASSDVEAARLEVGAVRARDQLAVLVHAREPTLQVVLKDRQSLRASFFLAGE